MAKNKKNVLIDLLVVILGNVVLSAGIAFFILPNSILSGGLAGIAIATQPFTNIEPQVMINVLTIGFFVIGFLILGKNFAAKTLVSSIVYPTFLTMFSSVANQVVITENLLLSSIYGGALIGIGVGLVFRSGASTGGMDIPPLIVNKYTGIALPKLVLITDALTVGLGALVFGVEAALIGLIAVWISTFMINKMIMLGAHESKSVMIISDEHEAIVQGIYSKIERGVTLLEAMGGYSRVKKPVVLVVISQRQYHDLQRLVTEIDPNAFMIISETKDVKGLGFSYRETL
ncbi:MAG: YitT family protein [Erysipelotrichaceae bacterium]